MLLIKFGDWNDSLTGIGKEGKGGKRLALDGICRGAQTDGGTCSLSKAG